MEGTPSSNRRLNRITRRALASGEGTPTNNCRYIVFKFRLEHNAHRGSSNLLLAAKLYSALTDLRKSNRPSLRQAPSAQEIAISSIFLSIAWNARTEAKRGSRGGTWITQKDTPEAQLLMHQHIKRYPNKESIVALMTRGSTGVSEKQNGSSEDCLYAIYVGLHLHLLEEPSTKQYILATNMVRS